jgi:hypothetical protein
MLRQGAAAFAVAIGIMAITGTGASAGALGLPEILNGRADSQALRIDLLLPSTDSLNGALAKLGVPTTVLPGGLLGNKFTQIVSLNHGEVARSATASVADHASGFAAPLQGLLGGADKVESRCDSPACGGAKSSSAVEINVLNEVIPGGLGTIRVAGADSITRSMVDTRNVSGLADVNLSLKNLFAIPELAPLAEALQMLTETVNDTVLPLINPTLDDVGDLLADTLDGTPLEGAATVGPINPIPDLTKVSLLDLSILDAIANVNPMTPKSGPGKGVKGLQAQSSAKVANLDILGTGKNAWAHLGAVGLTTSSFANGVAGSAKANSDVEIVGADLGGLLGLSIPTDTLRDLTNGTAVKEVVKTLGLPGDQEADLLATVDLIYNVAGITITAFGEETDIDPKGNFANASAGTLAIRVEPKIPDPQALLNNSPAGAVVPKLSKSDYISTGLVLQVALPNASSAVSIGKVLPKTFPPPPNTGVGLPLLGAVVLMGSAILIRRFALAK